MGKRVKILQGNAGLIFSYDVDQIVDVTERNADYVESIIRAGLACYVEDEKKKDSQPPVQNENPDVYNSPPLRTRGRRRIRKADEPEG